jgi:hypothetical protein
MKNAKPTQQSLAFIRLEAESHARPGRQLCFCVLQGRCHDLLCFRIRDALDPDITEVGDVGVASEPEAPEDVGHGTEVWEFIFFGLAVPVLFGRVPGALEILGEYSCEEFVSGMRYQ